MMAYINPSKTVEWATPQWLFDKYNAKYHFELDAAASSTNHKVNKWFGLDHPDMTRRNSLTGHWDAWSVWLNPPYGRGLGEWVEKAHDHEGITVMLVPARTDTKWFHDYCLHHTVEFIKGRLKFGDSQTAAPFPSMIVIFDNVNSLCA